MSPTEHTDPGEERENVERELLAIVGELVGEIRGTAVEPMLDHSLDRDLGIGSLERVELLLRLERAFGVRLADSVMAEAVTPNNLVAAVLTAQPLVTEPLSSRHEPLSAAMPAPASAETLVDVLYWHANRTPDRVHLYLCEGEGETVLRYGELLAGAQRVGAGLRRLGIKSGDTVALMLRTESAFFPAFLGILLIGAVPVPLYPPFRPDQIEEYARRQSAILRNAGARVLITFSEALRVAALLREAAPLLEQVTTVQGLGGDDAITLTGRWRSDDSALIQYTSGSTGDPKGVLLSHANLLANIRAFGQALEVRPDDVTVSWLPLYHDMGLIGAWLGSLYHGVPLVLLSPLTFLSRPSRWLSALHTYSGTVSAAPNFAFDLCVHKITDDDIQGLDLHTWRLALNGSEAVSPETIDRFTSRFAPYRFRREALCPVYGLAEASVALTMSPVGRLPRVDTIAREPFEQQRDARPTDPTDPGAKRFVSCGRPLPGHDVRIVDESGRPLEERAEGRVQFRGPSVTSGYFGNPGATRAALHDGWMDSGDLGYRADGELFITDRAKDIIIQAGRNLSAREVEEAASAVPDIRKGCVAAFGVHDPTRGTERLVVVAETRVQDRARWVALRAAVRGCVSAAVGVSPEVVIAPPGAVVKTPSGKIKHGAIRDAYVGGTLGRRRSVALQQMRLLVSAAGRRAGRIVDWCGRLAFTAYVAVVAAATLPALWLYLIVTPPGRHADQATRRWARLALAACGLRPRIVGLEHLRGSDTAILVANHASYIDAIVLLASIPTDFHFIAKRRLTRYPLLGTIIRKGGHATIEKATVAQQLAGAEDLAQLLREGRQLLVFPEGTFVRRPGLLPFRLGAFRAAVDSGHPIVPIALRGTRRLLPAGSRILRHGPVHVIVLAPVDPTEQGWPEMVRLRDLVRTAIAQHAGESPRS